MTDTEFRTAVKILREKQIAFFKASPGVAKKQLLRECVALEKIVDAELSGAVNEVSLFQEMSRL